LFYILSEKEKRELKKKKNLVNPFHFQMGVSAITLNFYSSILQIISITNRKRSNSYEREATFVCLFTNNRGGYLK
jgi:hypothetical protein